MLKKKISTSMDYIFIRNTSLQVVSTGTFDGFTKYPIRDGEPKPGSLQNHTDPNTEQ